MKETRNERTKREIKVAFVILLKDKGIDRLSVSQICKLAPCSRSTFYQHYTDKYALLMAYQQEVAGELAQLLKSDLNDLVVKSAMDAQKVTFNLALEFFSYIKDHADMFNAMLHNDMNAHFRGLIRDTMWQSLAKSSFHLNGNIVHDHVNPDYFAAYVSGAHLSVVQAWLDRGCLESVQSMAKFLTMMNRIGVVAAGGI